MAPAPAAAEFVLSMEDLREVAAFAEACAREALGIFERERPDDPRPRTAIDTAAEFARGERHRRSSTSSGRRRTPPGRPNSPPVTIGRSATGGSWKPPAMRPRL